MKRYAGYCISKGGWDSILQGLFSYKFRRVTEKSIRHLSTRYFRYRVVLKHSQ